MNKIYIKTVMARSLSKYSNKYAEKIKDKGRIYLPTHLVGKQVAIVQLTALEANQLRNREESPKEFIQRIKATYEVEL